MCFSAVFVIPCKWRKEKALEKYRVSTPFSAMTKASRGYSTVSEKSFGTEIQGLPLVYSQDEIKANSITHLVTPKGRVAFGGEDFHLLRALSQLKRFQQTEHFEL